MPETERTVQPSDALPSRSPSATDMSSEQGDAPEEAQTTRAPSEDVASNGRSQSCYRPGVIMEKELEGTEGHQSDKKNQKAGRAVDWDGPNDPQNPRNWKTSTKRIMVAVVCILTANVTFASSAPSSGTDKIAADFHISSPVATLITSLFLCGYCAGPIVWSTGSEQLGRRPILLVSTTGYVLLILGQALAPTSQPQTLLVTRFLSGVFASAPLTVCGGIIADLFDAVGRGRAMSLFSPAVFVGTVLGPIVGSFTAMTIGYRWIFWEMLIFGACMVPLVYSFIPETYPPVLLQRKARRMRKEDPEGSADVYAELERSDMHIGPILSRTFVRPWHILFAEPVLLLIVCYISIVYGLLYGLLEAFPIVWGEIRGFNEGLASLPFLGVLVGTLCAGAVNYWGSTHYPAMEPIWLGNPPPEERLWGAMVAAPSLVIGAFFFGWTGAFASVPWYVPLIATIPIGMAVTLIFLTFLSYIVDAYTLYSASALASNTVVRSIVGAAAPLFFSRMFHAMGTQWASTLLGLIALLLSPSPFIFYVYGPRIRSWSRFAPALDLGRRRELEEQGRLPRDSGKAWFGDLKTGVAAREQGEGNDKVAQEQQA